MRMFGYISILIVLVITSIWAMSYFKSNNDTNTGANTAGVRAAAQAQYYQKKSAGTDFSNGPCLSNDLVSDYVLDIVHNPREEIDNLPENQCSAYLDGTKKHFIELDLNGNVVRMQ